MDFLNDDFGEINVGDVIMVVVEGNFIYFVLVLFFGCVNYVYVDCYLFEFIVCYDGFFKFVCGYCWGFFFFVFVGWCIFEEVFFEFLKKYVQNLKLRVLWGEFGN